MRRYLESTATIWKNRCYRFRIEQPLLPVAVHPVTWPGVLPGVKKNAQARRLSADKGLAHYLASYWISLVTRSRSSVVLVSATILQDYKLILRSDIVLQRNPSHFLEPNATLRSRLKHWSVQRHPFHQNVVCLGLVLTPSRITSTIISKELIVIQPNRRSTCFF